MMFTGSSKVLSLEDLSRFRETHSDKKIVHCHGVFDILHAGHLAYFRSAKKIGDLLVVTLTADKFVNKGPGRPYFNSKVRTEMLAALECVDAVAVSHFPTAVPAITSLKPNYYVKGPDYKNKEADATGAIFEEERAVGSFGGQLVFTEDDTHSSSGLLNKFFQPWSEDQQRSIDLVKKAGGLAKFEEVLERMAQQSILIAGEPIVDTYVFCEPENISSKSPSISASFRFEENYAGGAMAIANHLVDFTKDTKLCFTHGNEPYFLNILEKHVNQRIQLVAQEIPEMPTPRKTRYITVNGSQRLFELTHLKSDQWLNRRPDEFQEAILKANRDVDATIIADFGHGLFEGSALQALSDLRGFVGLNVQTNSSNFGFNPYTKHRRFDYLSIDSREVRVAYHDRLTPVMGLAHRLKNELSHRKTSVSITLGASGAVFFPAESTTEISSPAFSDTVVDATGAGDAYFAMTALLVKTGCPNEMIPFIGNVFAGLKTKIIGNKSAVTRAQLLKAVTSILK